MTENGREDSDGTGIVVSIHGDLLDLVAHRHDPADRPLDPSDFVDRDPADLEGTGASAVANLPAPERDEARMEVFHVLRRHTSVKDLIEALGVPHTEVGRILVEGQPVEFAYTVHPGDRIDVYGARAPETSRSRRFIVDVHLGKLAGRLRLLGLDASYGNDWEDAELATRAVREHRTLLTRDRAS